MRISVAFRCLEEEEEEDVGRGHEEAYRRKDTF
jgi:hypothetical protein